MALLIRVENGPYAGEVGEILKINDGEVLVYLHNSKKEAWIKHKTYEILKK